MKKFLGIFLVSLLVLTGCGKEEKPVEEQKKPEEPTTKTLTCKLENSEDGMNMEEKYVFTFDSQKEELSSYVATYEVVLDNEMKEYYDDFFEEFKTTFVLPENAKGVEIKFDGNDIDTITMTLNANYLEMDEATKEEVTLGVETTTYSAIKNTYVEDGYTCE